MLVRRILVPIDFSSPSAAAAVVAGDLAEQLGARLRLVTVLDVADLRVALRAQLSGFRTNAEVHRAVGRWVQEQFAQFVEPAGVPCTRTVRRGIVDREILAVIRSYRPQLVVMGSRGLSHRLPLGSKTAEILRRSPVPVLVVNDRNVSR